jgi:hypothetical protein
MLTTLAASNNFGDVLGDGVAGPLGLLIIVLMAIATVLLIRNMNARLRRLPDHFPDQSEDGRGGTAPADAVATDPTEAAEIHHEAESSGS